MWHRIHLRVPRCSALRHPMSHMQLRDWIRAQQGAFLHTFELHVPFSLFFWAVNWLHSENKIWEASLLAQWWRVHLTMQETWVWSRVREDTTCWGAANPVCLFSTEPACRNYWSPHTLELTLQNKREATPMSSPCTATTDCPLPATAGKKSVQQLRHSTVKIKWINKTKFFKGKEKL